MVGRLRKSKNDALIFLGCQFINAAAATGVTVVAVDVPSGVDADRGTLPGPASGAS